MARASCSTVVTCPTKIEPNAPHNGLQSGDGCGIAPGTLGAPLGGGGEPPGDGTPFGWGNVPLGGPALFGGVGEPLVGAEGPSGDRDAPGGAFVTGSEPVPIDCVSPPSAG